MKTGRCCATGHENGALCKNRIWILTISTWCWVLRFAGCHVSYPFFRWPTYMKWNKHSNTIHMWILPRLNNTPHVSNESPFRDHTSLQSSMKFLWKTFSQHPWGTLLFCIKLFLQKSVCQTTPPLWDPNEKQRLYFWFWFLRKSISNSCVEISSCHFWKGQLLLCWSLLANYKLLLFTAHIISSNNQICWTMNYINYNKEEWNFSALLCLPSRKTDLPLSVYPQVMLNYLMLERINYISCCNSTQHILLEYSSPSLFRKLKPTGQNQVRVKFN